MLICARVPGREYCCTDRVCSQKHSRSVIFSLITSQVMTIFPYGNLISENFMRYIRAVAGCFYPALRYSEGVTMRVPLYVPRVSKSLSPATSKSAFARAAHSRNISSWGSRHTFTVPRIFTRMPRARIACSADVARCCSQENFSVRTRTISASISSQVAIRSSLIAFSSASVGVPRRFAN